MIKRTEWKLEKLDPSSNRVKVYGGWIVNQVFVDSKEKLITATSVFVPDRESEWQVLQPKTELNIVPIEKDIPKCLL